MQRKDMKGAGYLVVRPDRSQEQYRGLVGRSRFATVQAAERTTGFEVSLEFEDGTSDGFFLSELKRLSDGEAQRYNDFRKSKQEEIQKFDEVYDALIPWWLVLPTNQVEFKAWFAYKVHALIVEYDIRGTGPDAFVKSLSTMKKLDANVLVLSFEDTLDLIECFKEECESIVEQEYVPEETDI